MRRVDKKCAKVKKLNFSLIPNLYLNFWFYAKNQIKIMIAHIIQANQIRNNHEINIITLFFSMRDFIKM